MGSYIHSLQGDLTYQTLHLDSHVHNLQGDRPPRPCTCGQMSTGTRATPSLNLHMGSHVHSLLHDTPPRPCTWGHIFSFQCIPLPIQYIWGHMSSVARMNASQTLNLWSHIHSHQGDNPPRPCVWCHTSTVSRVTPPSQTLHLQ